MKYFDKAVPYVGALFGIIIVLAIALNSCGVIH